VGFSIAFSIESPNRQIENPKSKIENPLTVLITGGCGFVGSNLAVALAGEGHRVTCLDNLSRRGSELLLARVLDHGCRFVHGDVRNAEDFGKLKEEYEVMIECSAEPSVLVGTQGSDAAYMIDNNLVGSVNCFEFARQRNIGVIFLSTSRVYPYSTIGARRFVEEETRFEYADTFYGVGANGISIDFPLRGYRSLYGATKLASEFLLQEYGAGYGVPSIINRCGVIAGPWQLGKVDQGVFTYWLASHYFGRDLSYIGFGGKGKQVRDLLHIDDLIDLIKLQMEVLPNHYGSVYNAGGSRVANLSLLETTAICRELTGRSVAISASAENRPADVIWYITDNRGIEEFGWKPTRDGRMILSDIHAWLSAHEKDFQRIFGS
jgi:CDP-paratose 2-epimerase